MLKSLFQRREPEASVPAPSVTAGFTLAIDGWQEEFVGRAQIAFSDDFDDSTEEGWVVRMPARGRIVIDIIPEDDGA